MSSEFIIALVVLVAIVAHVALYRWVRFKIHEGVVLQFLRESRKEGAPDYQHIEVIAAHTEIPMDRVATLCRKSREICPDPAVENSWRAVGG